MKVNFLARIEIVSESYLLSSHKETKILKQIAKAVWEILQLI